MHGSWEGGGGEDWDPEIDRKLHRKKNHLCCRRERGENECRYGLDYNFIWEVEGVPPQCLLFSLWEEVGDICWKWWEEVQCGLKGAERGPENYCRNRERTNQWNRIVAIGRDQWECILWRAFQTCFSNIPKSGWTWWEGWFLSMRFFLFLAILPTFISNFTTLWLEYTNSLEFVEVSFMA